MVEQPMCEWCGIYEWCEIITGDYAVCEECAKKWREANRKAGRAV